jgi:hypothetical protein
MLFSAANSDLEVDALVHPCFLWVNKLSLQKKQATPLLAHFKFTIWLC